QAPLLEADVVGVVHAVDARDAVAGLEELSDDVRANEAGRAGYEIAGQVVLASSLSESLQAGYCGIGIGHRVAGGTAGTTYGDGRPAGATTVAKVSRIPAGNPMTHPAVKIPQSRPQPDDPSP